MFHITERQRAEFRAEAFNFLNKPHWSNYDGTLFNTGDPAIGYETSMSGNRTIQLIAKYYF